MIKLLGIGLILITGTKIGADFSSKYRKRVSEIKSLKLAVETIRTEMSFNLKPLEEVLKIANITTPKYLKPHDMDKLSNFLNSLGKSDIDIQLRYIDFFMQELTQMEQIAIEEANKYAKTALTLGISISATLAIILF